MAFNNPVRIQQTPLAAIGTNPKASTNSKTIETQIPRTIGPLTKFDVESGLVVPSENSWNTETPKIGGDEKSKTKEQQTEKQPNERHEKWKNDQAEKRANRDAAKTEKLAKQQLLAKDFLQKGDLTNAAKSLGLSPQDFILYAQNAALSIPTKKEELTPEQARQKQEEDLRQAEREEVQDLKRWKFEQTANNYIRDNIDPVLNDKERFELLNKGDLPKIKRAMYDYMNDHYQKTGEVLSAEDVAESLEKQHEEHVIAALERNKDVKKLRKYFSKQESPVVQQYVEKEQEDENEEAVEERPNMNISRNSRRYDNSKPFWLLSPAEKADYVRRHSS